MDGLCFKYDYCYKDGIEDVLIQYGGDSILFGIVVVQDFFVDEEMCILFIVQDIEVLI